MKTRHVVGFVGASLLSFVAVDASAGNTGTDPGKKVLNSSAVVLQIGAGNEGRLDGEMKRRGPGHEQADVVTINKDGKQFVVVVEMKSFDDASGYGPWQCTCSSFELQAQGGPAERVHEKMVTNYKGDGHRLCNHPRIATDGDTIAFAYGSDYKSNRPNLYVGGIDHMCNVTAPPVMMNAKTITELGAAGSIVTATDNNVPTNTIDNNDGAPDIVPHGNGRYTAGYCSTAGNATEVAYALGLTISKQDVTYSAKRDWIMPVVTPGRIARPSIQAIDGDRALFCAGKGDQRPVNIGTECAILDSHTGNIKWKSLIAPSYRDPDSKGGMMHYFGQPTVKKISDTSYALMTIESNGMGKNTNLKGSNVSHLYTLDLAADALVMNGHLEGAATYQTHSTMCAGAFGVDGAQHVGVISASPTGIARASMIMVGYDAPTKTFTNKDDLHTWPVSWYGDSGHLANWYGENPMRQGRDFLRCIGNVPNPGYHVDGGYMKDVKSFFVAPIPGRVPGDYKNSLFLSFIPGQSDAVLQPGNPAPADAPPTPSTDNSGSTTPPPASSSGCACSTPGTSSDSGTMLGGLALVGLVIGATRRRGSKKA